MNYNNKIQFLYVSGSDERIAQSAWTSTSREITDSKRERIPNLVQMLWNEGHETPFEKVHLHFLVDTEIASHIHLLKHRISSANAESARYKELKEDKFYLPEDFKQVPFNEGTAFETTWYEELKTFTEYANKLYHQCLKDAEPILGRKRAKESARFFKTYNAQIQTDISFNLRSFANFMKLRGSEHAQKEIREIAEAMWECALNETDGQIVEALKVIEDRIAFENKCLKYKDLINGLE